MTQRFAANVTNVSSEGGTWVSSSTGREGGAISRLRSRSWTESLRRVSTCRAIRTTEGSIGVGSFFEASQVLSGAMTVGRINMSLSPAAALTDKSSAVASVANSNPSLSFCMAKLDSGDMNAQRRLEHGSCT